MTDLEIVKRIRAGHDKAYADLITRYEQAIYCAFLQAGLTSDEAVKKTQEVFVEGYMHLGNVVKETDIIKAFFRVFVSKLQNKGQGWYQKALKLEENERISLILRQIFNLSYEEIAEKMANSREKVAEFLMAAREHLTDDLPSEMPCEKYRQMMPYYMDNELSRAERMDFEVHVESCAACLKWYEALQGVVAEPTYEVRPESVEAVVLDRLQETFEENHEEEKPVEKLEDKLAKKQSLRIWLLVGGVLLFSLFSWLFSLGYGTHLSQESSGAGVSSPAIEVSDPDEFSLSLAQEIKQAHAVFVNFGMNRASMTEKAFIIKLADYIAAQPAQEYKGPVNAGNLGMISTNPKLSCTITITSQHKLLVETGDKIWELQTKRDELIDVLKELGI